MAKRAPGWYTCRQHGRQGFTLIEVLAAVAILSLVATAGLRLSIVSQQAVTAVKEQQQVLEAAKALQMDFLTTRVADRGTSGDVEWETEQETQDVFGGMWQLEYRRLQVRSGTRSVTLFLP
ncbi:MAG: type II secretion system GspH family protein [Synergistales bacterium]|nr:type II secretion system GspH family protein [Synergistales bacterium]